ncbi:MAG: nucleotidyltransferase domain-containing protein [Parcubacteria group bacterium]
MSEEEIREKIEEITDKIVREYQPEKIILFGSYAWGTPNKDSDLDFFIVKEAENTRTIAREIDRSVFPRYVAMDFVVYTPEKFQKWKSLGDPFLTKIINQGKLLYERT